MLYIIIMELKFNIAIVGSGLTGSITSLALAKTGYKIALIDPKSFDGFQKINNDTRTTALSKKSKVFFEHLNLWKAIKPFTCIIKNIMVNDGNSQKNIYFKNLQSKKNKPLGFMIRNKDLFTILIETIKKNRNMVKFDSKVDIFFRDQENVTIRLENKKKNKMPIVNCCRREKLFYKEKSRHYNF